MGWYNLSNKIIDKEKLDSNSYESIECYSGKPRNVGLWFSVSYDKLDKGNICEWHNHLNYNDLSGKMIESNMLNEKGNTFVTKLELEENTKSVKLSKIKDLILSKKSKNEIILNLGEDKVENLILVIDTKEDAAFLLKNFPEFDNRNVKESKFWPHIAKNFSGVAITDNFISENNRGDNSFTRELDVASFIAFSSKGFEFKTQEMKLEFMPLQEKERNFFL